MSKDTYDKSVWDQDCVQLLNYLGFDFQDGQRYNSPLREDSDSNGFVINGPLWYDHAVGKGGKSYDLALALADGDKITAVKNLYAAAGVLFTRQGASVQYQLKQQREKAISLLEKIRSEYSFDPFDIAPYHEDALKYLQSRGVSSKTLNFFSFVPVGGLSKIMDAEEIELIGSTYALEGKIILWYFKNKKPVYYVTRELDNKGFMKASMKNGVLEHPIWNIDALYEEEHVVWCEGMFDAMALAECGYGVAGEITCNLIGRHEDDLLKALRWRLKNHNSWTFTICLDDDVPDKSGIQHGNRAAEEIAVMLLKNNIDVRWVKHPTGKDLTDQKIDISNIFTTKQVTPSGKELFNFEGVKAIIESSKLVSEHIVDPSGQDLIIRQLHRANIDLDMTRVSCLYDILEKTHGLSVADIVRGTRNIALGWREIYTDAIEDLFKFDSDYYVLYRENIYHKEEGYSLDHFRSNVVIDNLRQYQKNVHMKLTINSILVEKRKPTWFVTNKVSRSGSGSNIFNLFRPTPIMLQEPIPGYPIPKVWDAVLDNLSSAEEKEWLLNHMAYYVQTFEKPITIPAFLGAQGTGKTAFVKNFALCLGKFTPIGNENLSSTFNDYLQNPCILLDELSSSKVDATKTKNKIKSLINETQVVNSKFQTPYTVNCNSYVTIASNEYMRRLPFVIEEGDRRFTIISGGSNKKFNEQTEWTYQKLEETRSNFYLYLISRPYDKDLAQKALSNQLKTELIERGDDVYAHYVTDFIERVKDGTIEISSEFWFGTQDDSNKIFVANLCDILNEKYRPSVSLTTRTIKPYLESLGFEYFYHGHKATIRFEFNLESGCKGGVEPPESEDILSFN